MAANYRYAQRNRSRLFGSGSKSHPVDYHTKNVPQTSVHDKNFYSQVGWVGATRKPIIYPQFDGFPLRFNPSYFFCRVQRPQTSGLYIVSLSSTLRKTVIQALNRTENDTINRMI